MPFPLIAGAALKAGASFAARRAAIKAAVASGAGRLGQFGSRASTAIGGLIPAAAQRRVFGGGGYRRRRKGVSIAKLMILKQLGGSRSIAFQLALMKLK